MQSKAGSENGSKGKAVIHGLQLTGDGRAVCLIPPPTFSSLLFPQILLLNLENPGPDRPVSPTQRLNFTFAYQHIVTPTLKHALIV